MPGDEAKEAGFGAGAMTALQEMRKKLSDQWHEGIYRTERAIMNTIGVEPEVVDYAISRPWMLGYPDSPRGEKGQGDALRHILLSAELHRLHPDMADALLKGHEYISGTLHKQDSRAREMDVFNNEIGKEIGTVATSRAEVEALALKALPRAKTVKGLKD